MNYRMTGYLLGVILLIESALMLLPTLVSVIYGENVFPFVITILILLAFSLPAVIMKPKNRQIYTKEGFVTVAAGWVLMSAFGALPFVISGAIPSYIDAFFETVSGFTTTGATILKAIEGHPKGILFWRSFTHWIGGMGVLVFIMALLPSSSGGQTIHLMRAEVPGPTKGKLVPKMKYTALILYGIYIALTLIMIIALLLCGLPFYDSTVSALATAGTGGFSVLNNSIAGYNSAAVEWVVALFMFLFSINFNLYYFILIGRAKEIFRNEELRTFLVIFLTSVTAIALNTFHMFEKISDCIRASFFQVMAIMSTTGFSTVDFNEWSEFSRTVMMILMIMGACAGSTAGGLKISRILILVKSVGCEIKHMLRPKSVNVVRLDGEVIPDETVHAANRYLTFYTVIIMISIFLISFNGFDSVTNFTAVLTCINNVGPGFEAVGPAGNFADFSWFSKIVFSLDMLFGRLEIMPMIILLFPFSRSRR